MLRSRAETKSDERALPLSCHIVLHLQTIMFGNSVNAVNAVITVNVFSLMHILEVPTCVISHPDFFLASTQ